MYYGFFLVLVLFVILLVNHTDGSRVSIVLIHICDFVCLSVCLHDKTKTAETKITKLGTGIVHHDTFRTNEY